MRIKLLLAALLFTVIGRGQYSITGSGSGNTYTQNFDTFAGTAGTLPANWIVSSATYNATYPIVTSGAATPTVANANGNNCYAGRATSASSDYSLLQKQATAGSTTFTLSTVNNTGSAIDGFVITWNVEQFEDAGRATTLAFDYRIGAGAWSTTGVTGTNTYTSTTGSSTTFTVVQTARSITITGLSVANASTVDFRFSVANGVGSGSNCHLGIDDFTVYATSTSPTIIVTPATLTGFSYILGSGPSANQSFIVSGTNLTADILLTPPTDYEISTDLATWYGSAIALIQTTGIVDDTTIYVRLKSGLAVGPYNSENTVASSSGSIPKNATCSGSVTASTNSITSDIISVASSEASTVSSIENDAVITTTADGVQVWQFTIRDGGAVIDSDALNTIVNSIVLTQNSGNTINDWSDAIQAVALFNGLTKVADGVVTATNITFTGAPLISVPDSGSVTLTVRLSIQANPNNSGGNLDRDDFVFSIDHANLVESSSGSQFKSSGVVSSTNGKNILDVVATDFVYTQQPTNTGQSATMASVKITATDVNGNKDSDFIAIISVTSTGTMSSSPQTSPAIAGVATFSSIIHNALGTGFTLSASSAGINTLVSPAFDISLNTTFQPGDLAILAVNTAAESSGSADEISFVCFQDILPGTAFYLTDNGYERVFAGKWGNTEGIISLTRASVMLPKGTIITIHTNDGGVNDGTDFTVYTCGVVDTNWTKGAASSASYFFDLNKDDQVWITQGGTWSNTATANHDMTYNGNVLYGWTDIPWKTAINYASTKGSTVYTKRECYSTDVNNLVSGASQVKFNDPIDPDFSTLTNGKLDWIALINNPANWNSYTSDANYDAGGYNYKGSNTCPVMTLAPDSYINGKWTGNKDTNWFNCGNWDTLVVPDDTVDVQVGDNVFNRQAIISSAAPFASYYGNIASAKNLTITGEKVEITSNISNILEVHGNLSVSSVGTLDMDDGDNNTADGLLHLYGNWTNSFGTNAFQEGNGTVSLKGSAPQIINGNNHNNTEEFYNIVLDNNFDTSVCNNIIAKGNLDVNLGKALNIASNDFAEVSYKVTINGSLNIASSGSLVQLEDMYPTSGLPVINSGIISMQRTPTILRSTDYIYWSSPVSNFPVAQVSPASWLIYKWIPTISRTPLASNFGGWLACYGDTMLPGKGYIIRGLDTVTATFTNDASHGSGVVNNGVINVGIERSTYDGPDYTYLSGSTTLTVNKDNDNYNLLGNPYTSAIDADTFLTVNTNIEGHVRLWSHGTAISASNGQSFYNGFVLTYTASDYVFWNKLGPSTGPQAFNGKIAAGQGFFVTMNHSPTVTSGNIMFNNSMRNKGYNNSNFFRTSNASKPSRIWLDITNDTGSSIRTLVGYDKEATTEKDRMYDAKINVDSNLNIYSLIDTEPQIIQGRPMPFDKDDKVYLGIVIPAKSSNSAPSASTYKIGIAFVDGIFNKENQDIFLEDKLLNSIHDLRKEPYVFTSNAGRFDDRFVLRYTKTSLGINDFNSSKNNVIVATSDAQIKVKSNKEDIKSVAVYDVLGREIYYKDNINFRALNIKEIKAFQQALIIKVVLENGQIVSKKIIF